MEQALDIQVRALLNGRRGDWQGIAKQADVSYSWLSKFVNRHIDNPGYGTLKRIHAALTVSSPPEGTASAKPAEQGA